MENIMINLESRYNEFLSYVSDLLYAKLDFDEIIKKMDMEKGTRFTTSNMSLDEIIWLKDLFATAQNVNDYQDELEIESLVKEWQNSFPIMQD